MNKNPIQSNLPEFNTSSMTSECLYQHPVKTNKLTNIASNMASIALIVTILGGLALMFVHQADRVAANQAEAIAKAVNHGEIEKINAAIAGGVK